MTLINDGHDLLPELSDLRRRLHRHPELGLQLPKTQAAVLAALESLPLTVIPGRELSSVVAVLHGATPGPTVLLRGDMDALPIREQTDVDYSSEIDGSMHACGHDLHTTMLVGAARLLAARRDRLHGSVVFMFQPGEEGHYGARKMLAEGLLETTGDVPIAAYGIHVASGMVPLGVFATRAGALTSASATAKVTVRGVGGHGSKPHLSRDPLPATCEMVLALQSAVTRRIDIFDPVVITVGSMHGGTAANVVPDEVSFEATLRCYSAASIARVEKIFRSVCEGVAAAHELTVDIDYQVQYPPMIGSAAAAEAVEATVAKLYGAESFRTLEHPMYGSEDFSFVLDQVDGGFIFVGATDYPDPENAPQNHSSNVVFEDSVLDRGASLLAGLALHHLDPTASME